MHDPELARQVMDRKVFCSVIVIILASITWPINEYFYTNAFGGLRPFEYLYLFILNSILFGSLYIALYFICGRRVVPAIVIVLMTSVLTFSYPDFMKLVSSIGINYENSPRAGWWQLAAFLALILVLSAAIWRFLHSQVWIYAVLPFALIISVGPILQWSIYQANTILASPPAGARPLSSNLTEKHGQIKFTSKSNVYFIVLDMYPRSDHMLQYVKHDNSEFVQKLNQRGFAIQEKARTSYPLTSPTMSSVLSMDYVFTEKTAPHIRDMHEIYQIIRGNNPVVEIFKNNGYRYVLGEPGLYRVAWCTDMVDECVRDPRFRIDVIDGHFLRRTPVNNILFQYWPSLFNRFTLVPKFTEFVKHDRSERPLFFYGHVMIPHDRMLNDACEHISDFDDYIGISTEQVLKSHIRCVNSHLVDFVDTVVKKQPNSIIIIQSDHGLGIGIMPKLRAVRKWDGNNFRRDPEWVNERWSIFSAIRLPSNCSANIGNQFSNVNTFRHVFSCMSGKEFAKLDHRVFRIGVEVDAEIRSLEGGIRKVGHVTVKEFKNDEPPLF